MKHVSGKINAEDLEAAKQNICCFSNGKAFNISPMLKLWDSEKYYKYINFTIQNKEIQ